MKVLKLNFILSAIATGLVFLVVSLGAFTRLADAGLGCPDWPTCYGHLLWPTTATEIQVAEAKFSDSYAVQFAKVWPEMVHRYAASLLGLLLIVLVFTTIKNRENAELPIRHTILLLVIIIWQGIFGALTVTEKLHPLVVLTHLIGGFLTFSLLSLLLFRYAQKYYAFKSNFSFAYKNYVWLVLAIVILQISSGGWMSANYAALSCIELPTCINSQYFPIADYSGAFLQMPQFDINHDGGIMSHQQRLATHIVHRVGGVIVALITVILIVLLFLQKNQFANYFALALSLLIICQVCLGLANVYFALPIMVAVAHNFVAALLVACLVLLLWNNGKLKVDN